MAQRKMHGPDIIHERIPKERSRTHPKPIRITLLSFCPSKNVLISPSASTGSTFPQALGPSAFPAGRRLTYGLQASMIGPSSAWEEHERIESAVFKNFQSPIQNGACSASNQQGENNDGAGKNHQE